MHASLLRKRFAQHCQSISFNGTDSPVSSCPSTPPCTHTWFEPPAIDFCLMTEEHRDQVFQLVTQTFFRDEPLNRTLAFDIPDEPAEFAIDVLEQALKDQCSFVAIDVQTEKIIGVILNHIHDRSMIEKKLYQSEKLQFILRVLHQLHHNVDLFERLNGDRLLHVMIIAIDGHYRGLRLTEKLIRASLERAEREFQLKGAFSEATSLYSSKAFRKQGFQILTELIYSEYEPERLSQLIGEHDRCQLLVKDLSNA